MSSAITILALLGGAAVLGGLALVAARLLRLDVGLTKASTSAHEWMAGLVGLLGLGCALAILFGAGFSFGLSTTASALTLCLCAGCLSMALRPGTQRAGWSAEQPVRTFVPPEEAGASRSKAA